MADDWKNGVGFGALFGALVASSSLTWIVSIVNSIMSIFPDTWNTTTYKYLIFAGIGAIVGYFIDKH
jgi:hypothetical protein